jgi:hypothetical protein
MTVQTKSDIESESGTKNSAPMRAVPAPYLKDELLDALARMNMELLSELWIARDRIAVLEQILIDNKVIQPSAVDDYVPSEAVGEKLAALRRLMVENVLAAPWRSETSVQALIEQGKLMRKAHD